MRLVGVLLATILAAAAALVPTPSAIGAFPGDNGLIAYTATLGPQSDICVFDPNGGLPTIIVGGEGNQVDPAWSADGSKLAYVEFLGEAPPRIKVLDIITGMMTDLGVGSSPAWSPTGEQLAFWDQGLWIMDADGTGRRQIDDARLTKPAWSPDGSSIVFHDVVGDVTPLGEGGLWLTTPEGAEPVRIADVGPANWSPDGTRLVADDGYWQRTISVMNADGTNLRSVAESHSFRETLGDSTWSPDGSMILFTRSKYSATVTSEDLWVADPSGAGDPVPLRLSPSPESEPDWQPLTETTPGVPAGEPCTYDLHRRAVTLKLGRHLIATGRVVSVEGHPVCANGWVSIQRWNGRRWKTVASGPAEETFRIKLKDRPGRYRAVVPNDPECWDARSAAKKHGH